MATGPTTDKTGQIQRRPADPADGLVTLLNKMGPEIARALPKHITPDRMARIVLTALRTTPKLAQCTPQSFLACVMQSAQLGLEVNTPLGFAYLIPRDDRKAGTTNCTLLVGYQGYLELAQRSGRVRSVFAHAVREGDHFEYELGLNPKLVHKPSGDPVREEKPITYVYAVARVADGDPVFVVLSHAQIEMRRARSQGAGSSYSPWKTDYEAMALKTGVRALWKWMPKSTEMARVEALEVAADMGLSQFAALDPEVSAVLEKGGLLPAQTDDAPAEGGDDSYLAGDPPAPTTNGTNGSTAKERAAKAKAAPAFRFPDGPYKGQAPSDLGTDVLQSLVDKGGLSAATLAAIDAMIEARIDGATGEVRQREPGEE